MEQRGERVGIVRLGAWGDIVHALPVAERLKAAWPGCYLVWVVDARYEEALAGCRCVDEVLTVDVKGRRGWEGMQHLQDFVRRLREKRLDLVVDVQGLIKSGVISWLSGAPMRVGFCRQFCREGLGAWFYNKRVTPGGEARHVIEQNLALVECLGLKASGWGYGLEVPAAARRYIAEFWQVAGLEGKVLVGVHPGGAWETKAWPEERYVELVRRLNEAGVSVLVTWGPGEEELAGRIARKGGGVLACRTSMAEFGAMAERLQVLVAPDTGPLHLAAALGVRTVGLFGPTWPERNGPYGREHRVVFHRLDCSGCYRRRCKELVCMKRIEVEEVFRQVMGSIRGGSG